MERLSNNPRKHWGVLTLVTWKSGKSGFFLFPHAGEVNSHWKYSKNILEATVHKLQVANRVEFQSIAFTRRICKSVFFGGARVTTGYIYIYI